MMCRRNIINRSPSMNRSKQTRNKPMRKSKQMRRRLDLSKYSDGSHDYLLKHVLMNDMCNRFNHVLQINLSNCSALTDQSLVFITKKCPYLRILHVTNCYRLSPKTIYFTVQKLQYLHKLELYGVISTHNKYYHIQQLQQLTYFLNELGIQSGKIASAASAAAVPPHDEEEEEQEVDDPAMRTSCIDFVFNETRKMSIITVTYWWQ
eukprot:818097_1